MEIIIILEPIRCRNNVETVEKVLYMRAYTVVLIKFAGWVLKFSVDVEN